MKDGCGSVNFQDWQACKMRLLLTYTDRKKVIYTHRVVAKSAEDVKQSIRRAWQKRVSFMTSLPFTLSIGEELLTPIQSVCFDNLGLMFAAVLNDCSGHICKYIVVNSAIGYRSKKCWGNTGGSSSSPMLKVNSNFVHTAKAKASKGNKPDHSTMVWNVYLWVMEDPSDWLKFLNLSCK
ncbi:UPF0420 protein C16orf58-like protein [Corchorus olitorius]|uniref:UPF0420 protein C16orf58-like protein n=1 Tax=Corchorus olitorius TaxID=93759 RepID=A0A1R3HBG9_9ROSI|nr:UPF0420 protein C16orf58-like protein [Corchorus olitorius]